MSRRKYAIGTALILACVAGLVLAQQRSSRRSTYIPNISADRRGVPEWEVDPNFKNDLFTFVRIQWHGPFGGDVWATDYPDSDLNFPFRLQQMTSMKVDPKPIVLELTDEKLFDYPFIYMLEVRTLQFSDEEASALRRYLLNGGFLMVDDFWRPEAWERFEEQMKKVFPDIKAQELPLEHPIFHCVFDLKEKPQVPGIDTARENRALGNKETWEHWTAKDPHYLAYFDKEGRMMAIICHNTDLGDGWEREGEEEWFFHEFSEKKAYPMGINIIFYAMTH